MRRIHLALVPALLALGLGACDDVTAPGEGATLQVAAQGDDASASRSLAGEGARFTQALSGVEGTVEFRARVYTRTDAGMWVELTGREAQRVVVDASGRGGAEVFATAGVRARGYSHVRVVFEEVKADLSGGIHVGAGLLSGTVRVEMKSDSVVVERKVDVEVDAGESATVLVNLNADAWLGSANTETRTASEAAFRSAVAITAR